MKRIFLTLLFIFVTAASRLFAQSGQEIQFFLVTCSPGTETYSIYGHSALRVINFNDRTDSVYNWGVFDFSTPHFAWKFAKGRLDYMLDANSLISFLGSYYYEKRSVYQQRINLEQSEAEKLLDLIKENQKPENVKYRYDFFYDDCSTRIRDLLEKAIPSGIIYPPDDDQSKPTFREKVGTYQQNFPWLKLGVDLIMGREGEKKTSVRDRMFLPIDMQSGLSKALVNRNGRMVSLLKNPEMLLYFDPVVKKPAFYTTPVFLFTVFFILIIILISVNRKKNFNRILDIILFTAFSGLSCLMIFFNFFTDHVQMRWNLNIIWLNPFIIICLVSLVMNKNWKSWFRIVFLLALLAFIIQILFPRGYNAAFIPLILTILVRSAARSGFRWDPLTIEAN